MQSDRRPDHELAQVAKPFVQLENWLVRKYEGTGLGLSIAKSFCELHSGWLQIVSAPGKGTTVALLFPVANANVRGDAPMAVTA